jgi:hypothetical protein
MSAEEGTRIVDEQAVKIVLALSVHAEEHADDHS